MLFASFCRALLLHSLSGESEKSEAAAGTVCVQPFFGVKSPPSATLPFGPASFWRGMFIFFKLKIVSLCTAETCPAGFGGIYARTVCGFDKTAKESEVFMEAMKSAVRSAKTNVDNKKAALRSMRRTA